MHARKFDRQNRKSRGKFEAEEKGESRGGELDRERHEDGNSDRNRDRQGKRGPLVNRLRSCDGAMALGWRNGVSRRAGRKGRSRRAVSQKKSDKTPLSLSRAYSSLYTRARPYLPVMVLRPGNKVWLVV